MYGQMTAGSWIYIGTQGILQGTYETFAECARQHFGGTLDGPAGGDRRPGRDGRRPAARGDDERRRLPRRGRGRVAHPPPGGDPLLRPARDRPGHARSRLVDEARARAAAALGGPGGQHRRGAARAGAARGRARCRHRPDLGARPAAGLHPGGTHAGRGGRAARDAIRPGTRRGCSTRWRARAGDAGAAGAGRGRLRLRQQPAGPGGRPPGHARGVRHPGLRPRVHPAALLPRRGPVPLGRALGRSRPTSPPPTSAVLETFPENEALARWIRQAQERVQFQGLPGADLLAGVRRARRDGAPLQLAGEARARCGRRS